MQKISATCKAGSRAITPTANSVSDTQIDCITNYLNDWESVSFDDKRKVVDILISHIDATSESVTIHWKI